MSQTLRNAIVGLSSTNNIFGSTVKGDRFTNTNQSGVLGTRIGGTAPFVQEYIPAYLQCGSFAQTTPATWAAVIDGSFNITVDDSSYDCDAINFTGDTTMADVAATIQAAIRAQTGGLETCTWDAIAERFTITSGTESASSSIGFLTTSGGTVGTDISGAGASAWMAGTVDYFAQVVPVQFIEGYTPYFLTPTGGLAPFYEFDGNLNDSSGSQNLSVSYGSGTSYTSFGSPSLGAVYTSGTSLGLIGDLTFPSGAWEYSVTFRMDDLPASGKTAVFLVIYETDLTNTKISGFISDAGVLTINMVDPSNGANTVALTTSALSADTTYLFRLSYDPSLTVNAKQASLFLGNTLIDDADFTGTPDFSTLTEQLVPFGTDDIVGAPPNSVGLDGFRMNMGLFDELQTTDYWTEQYNGGNILPLEYETDGTVICVLTDTPAYVPQIQITGLYKTISSITPNDITVNFYDYNNSSGVEDITFDTVVGLSGTVPFLTNGCIVTFTLDPAKGTSVLSGYAIDFNPS